MALAVATKDLQTLGQPAQPIPAQPENRVSGIFCRTVRSPFFWTTLALAALITFSAVVLTHTVILPLAIFYPAVAVGAIALGILIYKKRYHLMYEASLTFLVALSTIGCYTWHHEVRKNLVLSAIPLFNHQHHIELSTDKKVGAILAVVEEFEARESSILSEPVLEEEWKERNIRYLRISVPDMTGPSIEKIEEAVKFIHQNEQSDIKTLVHCKAGVGRSASMVVSHLLTHHRNEIHKFSAETDMVDKAIAYLTSKRPQVHISSHQNQSIRAYYNAKVVSR